jgi:diguanylate cyclase (GGDEF)-like protein/PAS domain S-box-containing protein
MRLRSSIVRHGLVALSFYLFTLLLNRPQVILTPHLGSVLWYPMAGVGLALMMGVSPWYGIVMWVCCTLTDPFVDHQPFASLSETMGEAGMVFCYAAAAYVLRCVAKIDTGLRRRRDVMIYVLVSLTASVASTMIGVTCLVVDHFIAWHDFPVAAANWFLSDAVGLLGIGPFLLVNVFPRVRRWTFPEESAPDPASAPSPLFITPATMVEGALQLAALAFCLWLMFTRVWSFLPHFYLSFLPIMWMALRKGVRRVSLGTLVFNFGVVLSLHFGHPTVDVLEKAAFFMVVCSGTGLLVAAEVNEREYTEEDLRTKTDYLNALIENCPLGIVVLNHDGCVEMANPAFEKMFLYEKQEIEAAEIDRLLAPADSHPSSEVIPLVFAGHTVSRFGRKRRKDGTILDVETYAVPLMVNGRVRGAYKIFQDISSRVLAAETERKNAEGLRGAVAELQRRTSEMSLLNEMRDWLECCVSEKETCAVVEYSVQRLFPESLSGTIFLFKSSRNILEGAVGWGAGGNPEARFPPDACWSVRRGQAHWSSEASGVKCEHLADKPSNQVGLCVPLLAQGNMLGVLHLEFEALEEAALQPATNNVRDAQRRLAISVAGHIAQSLAGLRLRAALRDQSIRDPLTGLYNRRFLEESLEKELHQAARRKETVAILFIDLDHFKKFNDTFGHEAGDTVIRAVAELFRGFFRSGDMCCRYGGEEFAIIMPAASAKYAAVRANALREEAKRLALTHNDRPLGLITLSIGVAAFPDHGSTVRELFAVADHSLYQSKACGRDAVTVGGAKVPEDRNFLPDPPDAMRDSVSAR